MAVYDVSKCIHILMKDAPWTYDDAVEYLEFNSIGAWVGEKTPIWLVKVDDDE